MTTEHDEALVERVALAMLNKWRIAGRCSSVLAFCDLPQHVLETRESWMHEARAVIYPPAPPKTRLQVARELLADAYEWRDNHENNPSHGASRALEGLYDHNVEIRAILAALALPAMED